MNAGRSMGEQDHAVRRRHAEELHDMVTLVSRAERALEAARTGNLPRRSIHESENTETLMPKASQFTHLVAILRDAPRPFGDARLKETVGVMLVHPPTDHGEYLAERRRLSLPFLVGEVEQGTWKGHSAEVERQGLIPRELAPRRSRPLLGEVERIHQLKDLVPVEAKPGAALLLDDGVKAPCGPGDTKTDKSRFILRPRREERAREEMKVAPRPKCSDDHRGGHAAQHDVVGGCRTSHRALLTRVLLRARRGE